MQVSPWHLTMLIALINLADAKRSGHYHKRPRKHHHHSNEARSSTITLEDKHKKKSHNVDPLERKTLNAGGTPEYLNYKVSAEMIYKAKYRECPPYQKLKCRFSKCLYQSCDKKDKWQDDCEYTLIAECDSKNWICDCDNSLGYYRFNSLTTECVHVDDIRCENANVKCAEDEVKVCPTDVCGEKSFSRVFGIKKPKPLCSNEMEDVQNCETPVECHCKYPLVRLNEKCIALSKTCKLFDKANFAVCPDTCEIKECINQHPNKNSLCSDHFDDETLYNCKGPVKCVCNLPELPMYLITTDNSFCGSNADCITENIKDGGQYHVDWTDLNLEDESSSA